MDGTELEREKGIAIQRIATFCEWQANSPASSKREMYATDIIGTRGAFRLSCSLNLLMVRPLFRLDRHHDGSRVGVTRTGWCGFGAV